MRQEIRIKTEAEKNMEENKRMITRKNIVAELGCTLAVAIGVYALSYMKSLNPEAMISNTIIAFLGCCIVGFHLRQEFLYGELEYNNGEHLNRYWLTFFGGTVLALICCFLPVGAWPFTAVFVLMSLFSSMSTGILSGAVLLLIPALIVQAPVTVFVLYFIPGLFAITLFRHFGDEVRIGIPLTLSMFCLLVCETAVVILHANERLTLESFVIPLSNIIISCILLFISVKLFASMVLREDCQ